MALFNDPIAELLTNIRNALSAQKRYVDIGVSQMKVRMLEILKEQGFIENFIVSDPKRQVRIFLKYTADRRSVIHGLKRISSPGLRRYVECKKIPRVQGGFGIVILTTSKGILDDRKARELGVGGEILGYVW
ncbi:MAG: 30S ribosomal protein S8 [Chlamydiota bacterium]